MKDMKAFAKELLNTALDMGCDGAEVCITDSRDFGAGVLSQQIEDYSVSSTFALGLRVQLKGKNGYAYTEAPEDARSLAEEAMDSARSVGSEDEHPMAQPGEYPRVQQKPDAFAGMEEVDKIELCKALEREAMAIDPRVKRAAVCRVFSAEGSFAIYNTNGLEAERTERVSGCYIEPVLEQEGEVRDGFAFRVDGEAANIADCAKEAVEEGAAQFGAAPVAPGEYSIILRNDAAASLLGAFSGMFSADAAQKGLSPLGGMEGQPIGSDLISITDDPLHPVSPSPFDDEGVPSVRTAVVEKGVLKTFLHNLKTAKKAGVASTSNGGRGSAGSPVGVRPSNFFIEPGQGSLGDLMEKMGDGLVITDFSGLHAGVNPISGRFSLLCRGRLIQNGQDVRAVNEITVSGDFTGILARVKAVGGDIRFSMPGGSCVGSPSLLIEGAAISGREQKEA